MPDAPPSSRGGKKVASGWQPELVTSLLASGDFARVMASGRRRRSGGVVVVRVPGPDGQTRVGYVAGRRVGKAVVRNRAKRRLREAVRRIALEPGFDYVLIADESVASVPFPQLVSWVGEGTAYV